MISKQSLPGRESKSDPQREIDYPFAGGDGTLAMVLLTHAVVAGVL